MFTMKIEMMKSDREYYIGHFLLLTVLYIWILQFILYLFPVAWWRDETARSSISRGIASKIIPNLPIWGINSEFKGIMVNKGRIHRELRNFRDIFWNLVKLDDELRWEIREIDVFRKKTQRSIRGIKNRSIWISNHGEIKDGSGMKFSESRRAPIEIKMKLNLNWNPNPKIDDTWR